MVEFVQLFAEQSGVTFELQQLRADRSELPKGCHLGILTSTCIQDPEFMTSEITCIAEAEE